MKKVSVTEAKNGLSCPQRSIQTAQRVVATYEMALVLTLYGTWMGLSGAIMSCRGGDRRFMVELE